MTEQEHQRAQLYLQRLEALNQELGFKIEPRLVIDVSGALGTMKAVADVVPILNWQKPAQADLPAPNGAKEPQEA